MLIQIGLEDIVNFPLREQIAYLLVERARLMDELDDAHQVYEKTAKGHIVEGLALVKYSHPIILHIFHMMFYARAFLLATVRVLRYLVVNRWFLSHLCHIIHVLL